MRKIIHQLVCCAITFWLSLSAAYAVEKMPKPYSVNINSASAQMLAEALNGVGQAKAQAIIAHRKQHGAFSSLDALKNVSGIGAATVEANKKRIRLK